MLVTVVIPAYQAAWCIAEALLSVADQHHRPMEVVVVDDCSSDGTVGVIEELRPQLETAGLVLRVIRLDENLGATNALMRGFAEANGDMICWLSADDAFVDRDKTSRQLVAMQSGAVVSHFTDSVIGSSIDESVPLRSHWSSRVKWADRLFDRRPEWRLLGLLFMNRINGTSVMLRKTALDAKGTFDSQLGNIDGDADLWMRYSALGARFSSISGTAVFYREHAGQTSKRGDEMTRGCTRTRVRMLLALHETGRLEGLLRRAWPVLVLALRGSTCTHWPIVGQQLCESSRAVRRSFLTGLLLRRLEAKLREDGLWDEGQRASAEADARGAMDSEEFVQFLARLNSPAP